MPARVDATAPPGDETSVPSGRTLSELRTAAADCTRCRLSAGRAQVVFGTGDPDADVMFVGEGPGAEEDRQGLPFVGRSGRLLDRLVAEEMGLARESCYIANVVKCRPPDNRDPRPDEVAACRPWLESQIDHVSPRVVVTLGNFASRLLLDTKDGIMSLRGASYPYRDGIRIVPTVHPAAVLRGGGDAMARMRADLVRAARILDDA